jgi:hypothetical protein
MRATALILLCLTPFLLGRAQERPDTTSPETSRRLLLYDPMYPLARAPFRVLPYFDSPEIATTLLSPPGTFSSPPSFFWSPSDIPMDISAPFQLQLDRQKRQATLLKWLGGVQLAGTAYIAYRHIKKYGFLK